jgi:hypothetical protein
MATTFVQTRFSSPSTDPGTLAYNSNVTAGTTLFALIVVTDGTTPTVTAITDTIGNTWTKVVGSNTPLYRIELWKAANGSSAANTVSVDYSTAPANTGSLTIFEFSGMGATTDGLSNTNVVSVAADPMPGATLTTTGAGVIFSGFRLNNSYVYTAWGDSFTDAGNSSRTRTGYRITTGGVSAAPTLDCSTTEAGETLTVVVYEQSVGGGGNRRRRFFLGAAA